MVLLASSEPGEPLLTLGITGDSLFHVMRNQPRREKDQFRALLEQLARALPKAWTTNLEVEPKVEDRRPDAVLTIQGPDGSTTRLVVEAKARISPSGVGAALFQLESYQATSEADGGLLIADYLSPRSRELLEERGINYVDGTGNIRVALDRPALFVSASGVDRDPAPPRQVPLRSLKGRSAGRIVRAILDFLPPYTVTQLAGLADSNPPMVYRVFELLEGEALLAREPRGAVTSVDWRALIDAWTRDYRFASSNRTTSLLAPKGTLSVVERLRDLSGKVAVTGSMAARGLRTAPTRLLALYVEDVAAAADQLDLREVDTGANVILAEPFDDVVFERVSPTGDLPFAAASQVVADLLTGPGRWPEEAQQMLAWMTDSEELWRARS